MQLRLVQGVSLGQLPQVRVMGMCRALPLPSQHRGTVGEGPLLSESWAHALATGGARLAHAVLKFVVKSNLLQLSRVLLDTQLPPGSPVHSHVSMLPQKLDNDFQNNIHT